jgi:hypothetical protein
MRQEEALARISTLRTVPTGRFEPAGSADMAGPETSPRRDLVRVEPAAPSGSVHLARTRPQAAFLAHLLAIAQRAPQTQEKRRAAPQDAINSYVATGRAAPAVPGRSLKRAV